MRTARCFAPPVTAFSELVARIATQAPRSCLVVFGLLTVVSVLPLSRYLHDPFEYDFRNLRNRRSLESGAALLAERVDPIFGRTLTPAVVIADRRSHTNEIRNKVLERDRSLPGPQLIGQVTTLDDFLPGDPATHLENRIGEPADNPYLYIASQIYSGLDGIARKLDPGPSADTPYETKAPALPKSLREAAAALRADELLRTGFGASFTDYYAHIKEAEYARFAKETDAETEETEKTG